MVSLSDYVGRMKEGQQSIYYVVGDTRAQAAKSPALERLRQKGYEVSAVSCSISSVCAVCAELSGAAVR
jgi:molecular chaperone HtpG